MAKFPTITATRLRELLDYDPVAGIFTWRVSRGRVAAGYVAGWVSVDGYRRICIDGMEYFAHRLAWFYVTGEWPADAIDHRDCIRDDNRFAEIREATGSQNNRNSRMRRDSTSGFKGVCFNKAAGRWQAQIKHAGRQRHLGLFDIAAEAHAAYCAAAMEIDPTFSRFA